MASVFVIAEAGVNHNGNLHLAQELVKAAAEAGADAIKFQTFAAQRLVNRTAAKADYQVGNSMGETQFEMLQHLELSVKGHYVLSDLADKVGIEFMSTPFDLESLSFLVTQIGVKRIKISSGDLTNLPLLQAAGQTGLPVILSTGMSTMDEVSLGLGALAHGRSVNACDRISPPSPEAFEEIMSGTDYSAFLQDITLLQCTSEYPAPDYAINLLAMQTLADKYLLPVGLSDHSLGSHISIAAAALGASVVEKHVTLDTRAEGPDHRASLDIKALAELIESIRSVEKALGTGSKSPSPQELKTARLVRRGLYATRDLVPGDVITESDIAIIRPENTVPPSLYWEIIGATVVQPITRGADLDLRSYEKRRV